MDSYPDLEKDVKVEPTAAAGDVYGADAHSQNGVKRCVHPPRWLRSVRRSSLQYLRMNRNLKARHLQASFDGFPRTPADREG